MELYERERDIFVTIVDSAKNHAGFLTVTNHQYWLQSPSGIDSYPLTQNLITFSLCVGLLGDE